MYKCLENTVGVNIEYTYLIVSSSVLCIPRILARDVVLVLAAVTCDPQQFNLINSNKTFDQSNQFPPFRLSKQICASFRLDTSRVETVLIFLFYYSNSIIYKPEEATLGRKEKPIIFKSIKIRYIFPENINPIIVGTEFFQVHVNKKQKILGYGVSFFLLL